MGAVELLAAAVAGPGAAHAVVVADRPGQGVEARAVDRAAVAADLRRQQQQQQQPRPDEPAPAAVASRHPRPAGGGPRRHPRLSSAVRCSLLLPRLLGLRTRLRGTR